MDRDKGIRGREHVDNSQRSSTLDLFQFGDFPPDGGRRLTDAEQTHHAKTSGYPDDVACFESHWHKLCQKPVVKDT